MLRKGIQIKDVLDSGMVLACFSTMGVIDKDGDLTLPGFIGKQNVTMLPAHDWKHVPIGKGVTREAGDQVLADLKMNLDIPAAKDWHSALVFDMKNPPALQQYSYGFTILDGGSSDGGEVGGQKAYRTLRPTPDATPGCCVHEVSPVLVGAGENTATLAAKSARFGDEIETALAAVEATTHRAKSLADLRAKEGRGFSVANEERLRNLAKGLSLSLDNLRALFKQDDAVSKAASVELGRLLHAEAAQNLNGGK